MRQLNNCFSLVFIILIISSFTFPKTHYKLYTAAYENVLGTSLDMKFSASSEKTADMAENTVIAEIKRLTALLSSYEEQSAFSKWSKTYQQDIAIPAELKEVLVIFEKWTALTGGKLSPAVGILHHVWKEAEAKQLLPTEKTLEEAARQVNQLHWEVHAEQDKAKRLSVTPLLLNSFVKSYIINKAVDKAMAVDGVNGAMVNIGGDIVVKGVLSEEIAIESPVHHSDNIFEEQKVRLQNGSIATSGNYKRGYIIHGKHYSHILDPISGMPVTGVKSATVIANDAVTAGALATSFNVLTPEESQALARHIPGIQYQIVTTDNRVIQTEGWGALPDSRSASHERIQAYDKEKVWNKDYELTVNIELAKMEGFSKRPFVAIWVVNSDNVAVKNIALWFNKPRWLPDLKEWYHQCYPLYNAAPQGVSNLSSPTRPAGSYSFKWDGKDDKGEFVKQDKYRVFIEAAREHGTHQLMQQEFNANSKEQSFTIPGNVEISSANVSYKKIQ